jgi:GGDEF domain-containing protein
VLVGATVEGAELAARRIEAAIAEDPACCGVTISCGTAVLDAADPLASVEHADAELYSAKCLRAEADAPER